jgi:tRNA(fMet)-specific endonuclease VapC
MNVLDTEIIKDMLRQKKFKTGFISPIMLIELPRGFDDQKRTKIKELLEESFTLLNIDDKIIQTYYVLYRKLKQEGDLLSDADLLIAATAIAHNLLLETNNKHFHKLKALGLKFTNS